MTDKTAAEPADSRARRPKLLGGALVIVAFVAAAVFVGVGLRDSGDTSGSTGADGLTPFPTPNAAPARSVSSANFVGSASCQSCHAEQYEAWSESTHGRAGGAPSPDVLIAPFDGTPIVFQDGSVVPRLRDGSYEFLVRQVGQEDVAYRLDGVIGGGHMLGGGTQGYVTRMADGTVRFLAFDWSKDAETWFCNTGSRLESGWIPVSAEMSLADCGDWPPVRVIGTADRFANCQECHGSQIEVGLDAAGGGYQTSYTTLQINCESCHGPARLHVERAERSTTDLAEDPGLASLVGIDKDSSLNLCFGCHALKDVLRPGYLPGEPLESYFALKFPVLGDEPYLPDGRVRTFAYQATHLGSACYLDGPMDCVSCHEPHGQGYWDTNKTPLASPLDDGQCTSCHASKIDDVVSHTFHPAASEGSRCVSCHMPYLQHPEVGDAIPFARSDHTISIPRPRLDSELGLVGACAGCHQDRLAEQLQTDAEGWWGEIRPHRAAVQGLLDARPQDRIAATTSLLHPGAGDPLAQFQGLARFTMEHLVPDDASLEDAAMERLMDLADDPDLDVRSLALAALHWAAGDQPVVRGTLAGALEGSDVHLVRERWKLALGFLGDHHRDQGEVARAATAYRKALELDPDDRSVHRALGLLYNESGDFSRAATALRTSLDQDPDQPLTWVNLGVALSGMGDPAGAASAYANALRLNPRESLAHFNLGNISLRGGDLEAAVGSYSAAVESDPGLARAHFNLARTLIQLERYAEALPHARRAVEFEPDYALARQMLSDLEVAVGGS